MTGSTELPLLFLDVDGPLIPFGATPQQYPNGYPTRRTGPEPAWAASNPLLARINPEHGSRLAALPCDLVWATAWMEEANERVAPLIGLPRLPVVIWPDPFGQDSNDQSMDDQDLNKQWEADERAGLHWKTRTLVAWAAGRPFAWVDDELTDIDQTWVSAHHRGEALLHRVDARHGLTDADFAALEDWLRAKSYRALIVGRPYRCGMRELVVLGTASQVPTATRNHNGYFLRWDAEGLLFDPGEGTQRQMLYAGVPASDVTRICVTHFHGDHCFGLPGVLSRMRLDGVERPVDCHYPQSGRDAFARLRWVPDDYAERVLRERPADGERCTVAEGDFGTLAAVRLVHGVDSYGYRLTEPDGRRMLPEKLREFGVQGPDVGRLHKEGRIELAGRTVTLDEASEPRPGQVAAFVMDTGLCDGVYELAEHADLLVIESTFLDAEAALAATFGHLTAAQAARVAAESGVRSLVLTHFSQRYRDPDAFEAEARQHYDGELHIARDLDRIPVPKRV